MKQLPKLIVNSLIAAIAASSTIFCFTTGFSIPVFAPMIVFAALLFSFYFSACFLWKKLRWSLIPFALALLFLGFFTSVFSSVGTSAQQLLHDVLTRFSTAYPNYSFIIPPEPEAYLPRNITLLLALMAGLVSLWMSWSVGYRSTLIGIAGTLPFLLICVIINDTPPDAMPLVLLISCWITVLLSRVRTDDIPIMDAVRLTLVMLSVLLVFGIVGVVYPKDDTSNQDLPKPIQEILAKLPGPVQTMLDRNSTGQQPQALGADTADYLDLTIQGTRNRTDDVLMQLSATESGVLYLRAAAKDIYTGTAWESHDFAGESSSVYAHTSLGTAFGSSNQAAVQIKNYHDDQSVLFAPYGYISCTNAEPIISDLRINVSESDYIVYYWPGIQSINIVSDVGITNAAYDTYVEETCLQLPQDTREGLYNLALRYGYDPEMSREQTIAWVAAFVRSIGEYKLNVTRQPMNYDFALYFLEESRQGYCIHFATAAAAMYRALGIPARYASGYHVTVTEAGKVTDVIDRDTHAWAEIYLSGLGWIPIETTPGFGETSLLPELKEALYEEPLPPEEPEPSVESQPSSQAPEGNEAESPEPSPETTPSPSPEPTAEPTSPEEETREGVYVSSRNYLKLLLLIPVLLILGSLVLLVRSRVILSRRKRDFACHNLNLTTLSLWQYLEKLSAYGAPLPKELEALALKAKFSQHDITEEEFFPYRAEILRIAKKTASEVTGLRRLKFRFLSCLTLPK